MSVQKRPKKPSAPLGHIVFPKKGKPYRVLEPLPASAKDLEAAIVDKFVGALRHFEKRELSNPLPCDPWPDFEAQECKKHYGIEVVEIINPEHARRRAIQAQYAQQIRGLINDISPRLAGLSVQLIDGYQDPPYPPLNTAVGQQLASFIADQLRSEVEKLEALKQFVVRHWQRGPERPEAGAFFTRVAPKESGIPVTLHFLGSFPEAVSVSENLLSQSIEGKLRKSYTKYKKGRLCLLAYEVFSMSVGPKPSKAAAIARELLDSQLHPFDEVWYIHPYAGKPLGHIERVWP